MDGFDDLYVGEDIAKKWDNYSVNVGGGDLYVTEGRFGSGAIRANSYPSILKYVGNQTEVICGFAFNRETDGYNNNAGFFSLHGISYEQGRLLLNTNGTLQWVGNGTNVDVGPSTNALNNNTWYYIEVRYKVHNTAGEIEVRVNGSQWLYATGDTLYSTENYVNNVKLLIGYFSWMRIDDLYILNTSGTKNNDFLGNVRVVSLSPNGAGNYAQFTPSAGSNYQCVDDADWSGSDYVESDTDGEIDTYTFQPLNTPLIGEIYGIELCNGGKRTIETGLTKMKHVLRKNSTDYISDVENVTDDPKLNTKIYEVDPEDSQDWTKAKLAACEFGYQSVIS
jgi:hypothetical protein